MFLINNKKSSFVITPKKDTERVRNTANVLASYLEKITGCTLPICGNSDAPCRIVLDVLPFSAPAEGADDLGEEGFAIIAKQSSLLLYAATEESLSYAVYHFLEEFAGCLWLTSQDDYVPKKDTIEVPDDTKIREIPCINYREVYYRDAWEQVFTEKQKINGQYSEIVNGRIVERHRNWGFWCHSFAVLANPKEYFAEHPEYYALIDGKRDPEGQLCCTNDEVVDVVINNLRKHVENNPGVRYWSVSQNDNDRFCTCEKCRKADEEAGSHIGSIMYLVNKVADAFPDKIISTLSYWYSRTAPKKITLRDNVHIMLCNIECDRSKPMPINPQCESFVQDLRTWHDYCGNVFLWDYDIQFANLYAPFPNFHILQENMQFFYENNVRSIFNQANRESRGDFWALRAYLLAKLSWNPYCDFEKHYWNFMRAYYGPSADAIDRYIKTMTQTLRESGEELSIFGQPDKEAFLSATCCKTYETILADAANAAKDDPVVFARVEEIRFGLVYARLKAGRYDTPAERDELIAFFNRVGKDLAVERVEEWGVPMEEFIQRILDRDNKKE